MRSMETQFPFEAGDTFVLKVKALLGINGIRALRWTLKALLPQHGLRCVDIRREG